MSTKRQQYNLEEAISYVLEPGLESEMPELEDSGHQYYEPEIINRVGDSEEEESEENKEEPEELPENENEQETEGEPEEKEVEKENGSQKASKTKKQT